MSLKGFTSCPNQILFDSSISINARLLFTQLNYWDRGNGSGCFARRDTISRMTGWSDGMGRMEQVEFGIYGLLAYEIIQ